MVNPKFDYYDNGRLSSLEWINYDNGFSHREDGPAYILYRKNGEIGSKEWFINDEYHRLDGPAEINLYLNSSISDVTWCQHGKIHREDGPAHISYYENGIVKRENWFQNHVLHRDYGPADITYKKDGSLQHFRYVFWGIDHDESEHLELVALDKSIITKTDAIMNCRHDNPYIKSKCQRILYES
jgi:antitoxin component YwqK of YwqJK toxin-antitoxin module